MLRKRKHAEKRGGEEERKHIFLTGNTVVWFGQKLPITSAAAAAGAACDSPHSSGCTDDSWPLKKKITLLIDNQAVEVCFHLVSEAL